MTKITRRFRISKLQYYEKYGAYYFVEESLQAYCYNQVQF